MIQPAYSDHCLALLDVSGFRKLFQNRNITTTRLITNFAAFKVIKTILTIYCTFSHFGLSVYDSKDQPSTSPRGQVQGQGLTSLAQGLRVFTVITPSRLPDIDSLSRAAPSIARHSNLYAATSRQRSRIQLHVLVPSKSVVDRATIGGDVMRPRCSQAVDYTVYAVSQYDLVMHHADCHYPLSANVRRIVINRYVYSTTHCGVGYKNKSNCVRQHVHTLPYRLSFLQRRSTIYLEPLLCEIIVQIPLGSSRHVTSRHDTHA